MLETIITAVVSFAGTNVDDIFINTLFFAQADTPKRTRTVVFGKYAGMGLLVLLSCLGAYCLQAIPPRYLGLLGLIPMALGIKEWVVYRIKRKRGQADTSEASENPPDTSRGLFWQAVLVTFSNGADNLGVYIPLFAAYTAAQTVAAVLVFAFLVALWCLVSKKLSDLPILKRFLLRHKHWILPTVLIILGVYILLKPFL